MANSKQAFHVEQSLIFVSREPFLPKNLVNRFFSFNFVPKLKMYGSKRNCKYY